jgi:hypothetical protein
VSLRGVYEGDAVTNIPTSRTTRGAKVKTLTEQIKRPGLEFVQVDDIIDSDLTEALKGKLFLCHKGAAAERPS